jgi:hypothetical protein
MHGPKQRQSPTKPKEVFASFSKKKRFFSLPFFPETITATGLPHSGRQITLPTDASRNALVDHGRLRMSLPYHAARTQYPFFIKLWFLLDFVFCCLPPVYLSFSGRGGKMVVPLSILYFLFCGVLVTGSILAAFWFYERRDEATRGRPGEYAP